MDTVIGDFFSRDFMPHGHCYLWRPDILWTNVISDALIVLAYFSIPLALALFVRKRPDIKYRGIFWLFAGFIFFCGLTHLVSIYVVWHGAYGFLGLVKAITAVVSVVTAVVLFKQFPKIVRMPTPEQFDFAIKKADEERSIRHRMEQERKAEAIFNFAIELIPTGVLVVDAQRKIRVANRALEEVFGYMPGELVGKPLSLLLVDDVAKHHDVLVERYMKNPQQDHAMASGRVVRGKSKYGNEVFVEISLSVHEFDGEQHTFATVVDVGKVTGGKSMFFERSTRMKRALDATNDGVWEWNVQTGEVWYSPRVLSMIDKSHHDGVLNVKDWIAHVHPDDKERVEQALKAHFEQGQKYDLVYRGKTDSGRYEWLHTRGDTLFDDTGKPLLMSGVLTNINEQKQLEIALETKSRFLNAVLGKSLCGMYIFDLQSLNNSYINPQYTTITGYTLEELNEIQEQYSLMALFHPDEINEITRHFSQVTHNDNALGVSIKYRFKHKEGHWIWCYSRDSVYSYDDQGEVKEILGTFFDISELVEREEEVKTLAQDFISTFEQAAVGIAHISLNGLFQKANNKLCDILRYDLEELQRTNFKEITHPDDLQRDIHHVDALIEGAIEQYVTEKRYLRGDGKYVWAYLTLSMVRYADGGNSHFIAVIEDISERKQMEQALAASNASLERFAYSASHDLQEPLRKISTFATSVTNRLKDTLDDPDARFELGRINDASKRMRAMIDSLLQLSRYSRGSINKDSQQLSTLLEQVKDDLYPLIKESGAHISLNRNAELWVDAAAFQQVIRNLLINSIRYAKPGEIPMIDIYHDLVGDKDRIEFRDNGMGFAPEFAEQIFETFRRQVGRDIEGSGMGLAICRQIMAAHGGSIWAKSELGKGATFIVELRHKERDKGSKA